jgi:hypothetical protein
MTYIVILLLTEINIDIIENFPTKIERGTNSGFVVIVFNATFNNISVIL